MTYSKRFAYAKPASSESVSPMVPRFLILAAALGMTAIAPSADARPREKEQDRAYEALKQGRILPLRAIERMIVPQMRGYDYLGPELETDPFRYRLKFIRGARVVWLDVDPRNGAIIGKSGD